MPDNLPVPAHDNLAVRFPLFDPEQAQEIKEVLDTNLGPRGLTRERLPRIKWPTGGATVFMVETAEGDDQPVKELTGIFLAQCEKRMYYRIPFAERSKQAGPPDCQSLDGFWGEGDPGGDCARCPLAQWGSDPKGGRGQACKQIIQIFFLREQHTFPDIINVPPTSLINLNKYLMRLGNFRIPYWAVLTTIRLEKVPNAEGMDYARGLFKDGERLTLDQRKMLRPTHEQMLALLKPMAAEESDYETGEHHGQSEPNGMPEDDRPPY